MMPYDDGILLCRGSGEQHVPGKQKKLSSICVCMSRSIDGSSALQCSASSTWAAGRTMESTAVGATSMQLYNLARDLLGCPSGQVGHHN